MIFTELNTSVYIITLSRNFRQGKGVHTQEIMYSSLFDSVFADSFFSPMRTVYVVSDSQLENIKRKQRHEELDNLEFSRKSLEEAYQSRLKIINERENELQEELKALSPPEKEMKKCAIKT